MKTQTVVLTLIHPDPEQPRTIFQENKMNELRKSIQKNGILAPLLLESNYKKDQYLILDGERRYRLAKELNFSSVPAYIIEGPLTYEDRTIKRFQIQEQHASWTIFDKAKAIYTLKQRTRLTIAEVSAKTNLNTSVVHNWLSILDFSDDTRSKLLDQKVPFTYLIYLIRVVKRYLLITEMDQKDIEDAVVNKMESGIKNALDLWKWSQIMIDDQNIDEKIKFLKDVNYSFSDFVLNTKGGRSNELNQLYKRLFNFNKMIEKTKSRGLKLEEEHLSLIDKICMTLKEL